MPVGVQRFSCPRCRRGDFRSLPGPDGKAFCPWCGDAVSGSAEEPAAPPPAPAAPEEATSFAALAMKAAVRPPLNGAAAPADDLPARLAESERRREEAEADLRRERDKRAEIKKAVLDEVGRLEAQVADATQRLRRKDSEHAAAIEAFARMKEAKEKEWAEERIRLKAGLAAKDAAIQELEARVQERHKTVHEVQAVLDAVRVDEVKVRTELAKVKASSEAELADLKKRLAAAESRLSALKDSESQARDLKERLQEAVTKAAGLQAELEKRDLRIKELQLLVKTLGERLNELSDRRR